MLIEWAPSADHRADAVNTEEIASAITPHTYTHKNTHTHTDGEGGKKDTRNGSGWPYNWVY